MDPGTLLALVVPLAPLAGGLVAIGGGRLVPPRQCHLPVAIGCGLSCAAAIGLLIVRLTRGAWGSADATHRVELYGWFTSEAAWPELHVALHIDALSLILIATVSLVATLAAVHAAIHDTAVPGRRRAFAGIALVQFATVMLLSSGDLLQLFVFWQVLSVALWLLAGTGVRYAGPDSPDTLDREPRQSAEGAERVLLTNLAGDVFLFAAVLLCGMELGALAIADLEQRVAEFLSADMRESAVAGRLATIGLAGFLFAVAVVVRCGQFPLFGWLTGGDRGWRAGVDVAAQPDRLEAEPGAHPAAVRAAVGSALIQAAILPTGIYLIVRIAPLLAAAPDARWMLLVLGCLTSVIAAIVALYERDDDQILLFTTASQLGVALAGLATGEPVGIAGAVLLWLALLTSRTAFVLLVADARAAAERGATADRKADFQMRTAGWLALVALAGGLSGQHAALAALWSSTANTGPAHAMLTILAAISVPLTACALVRLWIDVLPAANREGHRRVAARERLAATSSLAPLLLTAAGLVLVAGSLLFPEAISRLVRGEPPDANSTRLDGQTTLVVLLLAAVGFSAGWLLGLRRRPTGSHERKTGEASQAALPRLARRRFYVDEVLFLLFVFPARAAAGLARFFEWLIVDGVATGVPRRLPGWAGRLSTPLERGSGQFTALALLLATSVLLIVLVAG